MQFIHLAEHTNSSENKTDNEDAVVQQTLAYISNPFQQVSQIP